MVKFDDLGEMKNVCENRNRNWIFLFKWTRQNEKHLSIYWEEMMTDKIDRKSKNAIKERIQKKQLKSKRIWNQWQTNDKNLKTSNLTQWRKEVKK